MKHKRYSVEQIVAAVDCHVEANRAGFIAVDLAPPSLPVV